MNTTPCKHCNRMVAWCRSENGNPIPLDPDPTDTGNIVVAYQDGKLVGHVLHKGETPGDGVVYISHFATCPVINRLRNTKPKKPKPAKAAPPPDLFTQGGT